MKKEEVEEIFKKIRSNKKKLSECDRHVFKATDKPLKYKCQNCGGEADIAFVEGYEQGIFHGHPNYLEFKSQADEILKHLGVNNESRK